MPRIDKLYQVCKFIQDDDKNSDILDCYQEFYDGELDRNTLIEICQDRLGDAREDFMNDPRKEQYLKHAEYLGIN